MDNVHFYPLMLDAMRGEIEPEVREAVETFIRSQFAEGAIANIEVQAGGETDDEIVLNVRVVFYSKPETSSLRNLVRRIRSDMHEFDAFPVFSFASHNALVGASA